LLHKLRRQRSEAFDATIGISPLDRQIPSFDVAELAQDLNDIATRVIRCCRRRTGRTEKPDPVHLPACLRIDGAGRGEETDSAQQDRASVH
jgi:hypothetical protein